MYGETEKKNSWKKSVTVFTATDFFRTIYFAIKAAGIFIPISL